MKQRKNIEVQRMETRQKQINREILERKKQMESDNKINERLSKIKQENEQGHKTLSKINADHQDIKENINFT